jgi:dTDP-4-dehydrorhamnose reductase
MKVLLIGQGYIGSAFAAELKARGADWSAASHREVGSFSNALNLLRKREPDILINAAAFIPPNSVAECDSKPAETILGNTMFPQTLAHACEAAGVAMAQISTGCLWSDSAEHTEEDPPQRAFTGHCGLYVGTKVVAEEAVKKYEKAYVWRVRLPFDEFNTARNYLSKLIRYSQVYDHINSLSHRGDTVKACLDLWEKRTPFGTYNVTNEGAIAARDIIKMMEERRMLDHTPQFVPGPNGGSKLSVKKLLNTGVKIRHVNEAVAESLAKWKPV